MSAIDLKTSLLVERQVPEFIRDEYPKFITFLKAYYEFLENDANTAVTSNNLVTTAKSLRTIRDVDESLEQFEKNFYNTYATLIPLDVQANKTLLFKHLTNLYRSKGSEGSFKLLFQLVFGEDIEVIFPKNNVLRASASNWQLDNKLRINSDVFGYYLGDGSTKTFYLPQKVGTEDITVFIDDVPKQNETDFYVIKEYRRLIFHTAPANNVTIRVLYPSFDVNLLNNRKAFGLTSGASAIIENANRKIISDVKTLNLPIELIIVSKTLEGNFLNGETVSIPIIDETNNVTIDIRASTFSVVRKINVLNAGNNYSIGSIVTITGGNAAINAVGTVSGISSGALDQSLVHHGGAIFSLLSPISISGNDSFVTMTAVVDGIDLSGANAANSFIVSPDIVANLSLNIGGTVFLNSANFGAVFSKSNVSGSNTIAEALNFITIQAGPITNVSVIGSTIPLSQKDLIVLDAAGAEYGASLPKRFSKEFKSIGRFKINDGGSNYRIGDEIVFGPNPLGTYGQHAAAVVGNVAASTGAITRIDCANTRIRGTGSVAAGGFTITGTNTFFTQDLKAGDVVDVNGESRLVSTTPISDTSATVTVAFTYNASGKKIGVYNRWPLGGYNYTQNNFPTITVDSATGAGADVEIDSLIGDGERLSVAGGAANGQVTTIEIINPGSGYQYIPTVNIGGGDGTATATVEIEQSYIQEQGRWTTSDSILSSFERKIQGEDFYVDYSYVISSQIEFSKYKTLLKNLLHPVGLVRYAFYNIQQKIELTDVAVQQSKTLTISGTVNVGNGSAIVVGTNTKFNIANSRRIISIGSSIAVNGEMRRIDNVVSNTRIVTTSNVSGLRIVNPGEGYSNGYLVFSNGGGQITSLTITNSGSGYENGSFVYSGTEEAINAFATYEVYPSNGALRSVTLLSGGLYASAPILTPNTNPHKVLYANGISITNPGQGYSNGWLQISGGTSFRDANVRLIVHPNTTINTVEVLDSGLYLTQPTLAVPNTNSNVVISNVTVTSKGNGHSNGVLTFSGGDPARAATVRVETFPSNTAQVVSITANNNSYGVNGYIQFSGGEYDNISANARIYVNSVGGIVNVVVQNRGLYKGTPTATANAGNAVFTLNMLPMDGQIRKITIVDPGIYSSAPTATLNTTPTSISSITSNTVANTFVGKNLANGYLIFSGGLAVRDANATYQVYPSNGVINMESIIITDVGLYRVPPTVVTPNVTPVSVTQVLISSGGAGYVAGNVVFSTSQDTANVAANATVGVDGLGSINKIIMNDVGLYANGQDIIIVGILDPETATLQTPTTSAVLSVGYNANTLNIANLVVSTSANAGQTAVVGIVANSNSYTNATFSLTAVPNTQTNAVITVGFTQQNTAANVLVEIYPNARSVTSVTTNAGAIAVNSWINFSGPFVSDANIANARIFVNTTGHIQNVTVYANGLYSGLPIISNVYTSLLYYQNNQPIIAVPEAYTNAVFTIGTADYSPNGAIRRLTVNTKAVLGGTGRYYYTPDVLPNTTGAGAGSNAVITFDPIPWYQTANGETAIILSPITPVITESGNDLVSERGDSVILE